jgi:hypothetical protein
MSRDTRDANAPERQAELLAAYVDGVAELSREDRREIEARLARDPQARAEETAVRELLGRLRDLPPEGVEPDWAEMARSIRDTVGDEPPRPWWRRWRWLVPLTASAAAAVMIAIAWRPSGHAPTVAPPELAANAALPPPERAADDTLALWLDGSEVDVDPSAVELLGGPELAAAVEAVEIDDAALPDGEVDEVGLLPANNLAWVDSLDDDAIDRAERWLDGSSDPASGRKKG